MKAYIDRENDAYLWTEVGDPVCGIDFCDQCGDCLHCYWDDECYPYPGEGHSWVIYRNSASADEHLKEE